jgi:non-canonical (house-cleaning) NTP pyrophosphatase
MTRDTKDPKGFWQRLQAGVEVAVAVTSPDSLLGVRDAFVRYFHDGLDRTVSVAVVPQQVEEPPVGLLLSDEEILKLARRRVAEMEERLGDTYHFYIATEAGLDPIELDGTLRYFVRNWTVVKSPLGEAWGASGSVQLPDRIVAGLDTTQVPFAVPGTRRSGGILSSLTGGLETRRKGISQSTLYAISSLFYGVLESRPIR